MRRATARGMTLVEVSVAIFLLALIMTFVYETLANSIRHRDGITEGLEAPKAETAILDEIVRDLRFVYYRPGQFPADAGFWGRDRQVNGRDADRLDFLTCRQSRTALLEDTDRQQVSAPLVEVGYACRPNDAKPEWIELWRRERYFADDDPTDGGQYDLVYDKIRRFDIVYYKPPEERGEGDRGLKEWDSKTFHEVPYAMEVTVEFDVREPIARDEAQGMVKRIVLLTPARSIEPASAATPGMSGMR